MVAASLIVLRCHIWCRWLSKFTQNSTPQVIYFGALHLEDA